MPSRWQARRETNCANKIANLNDSCADESQDIECEEHGSILKAHGSILKAHGSILEEHGSILEEHGSILDARG